MGLFIPGTGRHAIGALSIATGNGAMIGFHQDHDMIVSMRAIDITAAWDVMP